MEAKAPKQILVHLIVSFIWLFITYKMFHATINLFSVETLIICIFLFIINVIVYKNNVRQNGIN